MTSRLLFAATVAMLTLMGCKNRATDQTLQLTKRASKWDSTGIRVAAFVVSDDFDQLVDGNSTALSKTDLPLIAHVDLVLTAEQYEHDFDSNEISADRKYASRKLLVFGRVTSINKDAFGQGYFTLSSPSLLGVQAHLKDSGLDRAAATSKGDKVAIVCDPGIRISGFATLNNCLYLSQYMAEQHLSVAEQVQLFFAGKLAIPIGEFAGVLVGYQLGVSSLTPASCKENPNKDTCDFTTWKLSKPQLEQLASEVETMKKRYSQNAFFKRVHCGDPRKEFTGSPETTNDVCVIANEASS